jgi:predicted ATPase
MNERELISVILSLLRRVVNSEAKYSELQNIVDDAVAKDTVSVLSESTLAHVFDLQKDLELIAVRQASSTDRASSVSQQEIVRLLAKYLEPFTKVAGAATGRHQ